MAETAKTIVTTVNHGTLSTLTSDGTPLGTYVAYVLDEKGCPVMRLRSDAVHKRNLEVSPKCSLFVHAPEQPARRLARVTLIGSVSFVEDKDLPEVKEQYRQRHPEGRGIDDLSDNDQFGRLNVDKVFYVGGLDGNKNAEVVNGSDYLESQPDPLRLNAPEIVRQWNSERMEDIYRICKQKSGVPLIEMTYAELAWVDRFGFYISYSTINSHNNTLRIPFPREAEEDRDARSLLTMTAHLAWESDRNALPLT